MSDYGFYTSIRDGRILFLYHMYMKSYGVARPDEYFPEYPDYETKPTPEFTDDPQWISMYYDFQLKEIIAITTKMFKDSFVKVTDENVLNGYRNRIGEMYENISKDFLQYKMMVSVLNQGIR